MNIKKYIRKQENVEVIQFNGKNCIECLKFVEPNTTEEECFKLARIRSVYNLCGEFNCLLVGENKIRTEVGDYIVKSELSGITVFKQDIFNKLFMIKEE